MMIKIMIMIMIVIIIVIVIIQITITIKTLVSSVTSPDHRCRPNKTRRLAEKRTALTSSAKVDGEMQVDMLKEDLHLC